MILNVLPQELTVAKFGALPELPDGFCSISAAEGEISLVCESAKLPQGAIAREDGWRALAVVGPLDFSLVGVLAKLSSVLADAGIPIFALSTYDTDYVLVKGQCLKEACDALIKKGYIIK